MLSHHHAGKQHYMSPLLHQQWPSQSCCLARAPRRRRRALTAVVVAAAAASSDAHEQRSLFIFGLGYTSLGLVAAARARGTWPRITSTSRRPERLRTLEGGGHAIVRYDPAAGVDLDDRAQSALLNATHVLTSIPPLGLPPYDPATRAQVRALAARAAAARAGAAPPLRWVGVLSSTSVYGDHDGGWVTEDTPPGTATARGLIRLEHERAWAAAAAAHGLPLHIFRLAGIYGPGRSVLDAVRAAAEAAAAAGGPSQTQQRRGRQRFVSRCHVADIARALLASMDAPAVAAAGRGSMDGIESSGTSSSGGEGEEGGGSRGRGRAVYYCNVADDDPAPRGEVEAYARELLGLPARDSGSGDGESSSSGEGGRSGSESSNGGGRRARGERLEEKRVSNARLRRELLGGGAEGGGAEGGGAEGAGGALLYPTYREGLAAIAAGAADPFSSLGDIAALRGG